MFSRRRGPGRATNATNPATVALDDFHGWVSSLPWVVERPYGLGAPDVRSFAIDCEPLRCRRLWLLTGLGGPPGMGIALILPTEEAVALETAGRCRVFSPMPGGQMLVTVNADLVDRRDEVEALVLAGYDFAMS